eukprot:3140344-Prymnesium_polylepis.1
MTVPSVTSHTGPKPKESWILAAHLTSNRYASPPTAPLHTHDTQSSLSQLCRSSQLLGSHLARAGRWVGGLWCAVRRCSSATWLC